MKVQKVSSIQKKFYDAKNTNQFQNLPRVEIEPDEKIDFAKVIGEKMNVYNNMTKSELRDRIGRRMGFHG